MTSTGLTEPANAATVLLVVDGLGISGKTKALVDLACGLDPARYRAAVCCFDLAKGPLADRLRKAGVPVYVLPCSDGLRIRMVWRLARLMRQIHPQVVHSYNPRAMLYAGLAAKLVGIKATLGFLSAFACQVPDRAYAFLPQALVTRSRRNRWRNRLLLRLTRYVIVVSQSLGERFFHYNALPFAKLRVIPYGADRKGLQPVDAVKLDRLRSQCGIQPGDIVIGTVGRFVEQKDYPTLLRAVARARTRVPELRLVIAGDGPLRQTLHDLAKALDLHDRTTFLGHCEDVAPVYQMLDVFVLASVFEPFGVALLEAKAAGRAIVATDVNEIPTIIKDGVTGLLVPPGDVARLTEKLVELARDPARRESLGKAALRDSEQCPSLDQVAEEWQRLYDAARGLAPANSESTLSYGAEKAACRR